MFMHLDEEKELEARMWVLDNRETNHMSGSWIAFTKLDTMRFNDNSVVRIDSHGNIVFTCWNEESQLLSWVYFIP
jgi:uncharacterized protein YuzE